MVLVGPSGSGKTTWARTYFAAGEVVSSDALRAQVGTGEGDLDASADAFAVLDAVVAARLRRGLTTVVDTLGLDPSRRVGWREDARAAGLPVVAVQLVTDAAVGRRRNAARDRRVPARVLAEQVKQAAALTLDSEGFDLVVRVDGGQDDMPPGPPGPAVARAGAGSGSERGGLQFALQVSAFPWGEDPRTWLATVARAAEEVGFSSLAVMDHLIQIPQVGRAWDPLPEAYVTLGYLAGVTDRIGLGALVTPVTFRSIPLLAKMIGTLDTVSGGRAFCGIGAGWQEREHAAYDLPFPSAGARLDALEEGIGTLRAFWGPGTKAHGRLPETTAYPRPLQGQVPVIVGGGGERRTLDIAARLGDGCNVPSTVPALDRKIDVLRAHCARAGRDPRDVAITVLDVPIVGGTPDQVAALVERHRGRQQAQVYARAHSAGTVADHVRRYRELGDRGVSTVFVSFPDLTGAGEVERFSPVVEAFAV